jgi:membrane protein implicated in regulation of membrane protease activity
MLRYSLLRLLIFFGVLSLLWLLGLRDRDEQWQLLVLSALISMVLSYFVLARFREESTQRISEAIERRAAAKQARSGQSDEAAEDAEDARETRKAQDERSDTGPADYR